MDRPLIYLIAGEPSGDVLGGRLMAALRRAARSCVSPASAASRWRARAGQPVPDARTGADGPAGGAAAAASRCAGGCARPSPTSRARRPAVVVTIDSPGFTLRVLRAIAPLRHAARALRRAAGLGLAGRSGATLSPACGKAAVPAAVRAGILRPPRPARDLRRPSGAGKRRRHAATLRGFARGTTWRRTRRC